MTALRCPFCHDGVTQGSKDAVTCDACGASHHLACFVECGHCSATACRAEVARVGGAQADLETLSALAADPVLLASVARTGTAPSEAPAFLPFVLGCAALTAALSWLVLEVAGQFTAEAALGAGVVGAVMGLMLWLWVGSGGRSRPVSTLDLTEARARLEQSFDPVTGLWSSGSTFLGDLDGQYRSTVERMRDGAAPEDARSPRPAAPSGTPPSQCPHCCQDLEFEDDAEPLWFCYHCSADLVDIAGRYLSKAGLEVTLEDPDDDGAPPPSEPIRA